MPKVNGVLVAPVVFPNSEVLCPELDVAVPKSEGVELPVVVAPTLPKRPPPELVVEPLWLEPNRLPEVPKMLPLEVPLEAGVPNVNLLLLDMAMLRMDARN